MMIRLEASLTRIRKPVGICRRLLTTLPTGEAATRVKAGYWLSIDNQRKQFDLVKEKLGVRTQEDWYSVTVDQVISEGGATLVNNYYNGSLFEALKAIYPEHEWDADRIQTRRAQRYWKDHANLRRFFDEAAKTLKIESMDQWYNVRRIRLYQACPGAKPALRYFDGSVSLALAAAYPEHSWIPWKFGKVRVGFWDDVKMQREFMDWAARHLGFTSLDGWYDIKVSQVEMLGGKHLLDRYYDHSLIRALKKLYPEHDWDEARFIHRGRDFWTRSRAKSEISAQSIQESKDSAPNDQEPEPHPPGFWNDLANQKELLLRVCANKGIAPHRIPSEDLYNISSQDIISAGGGSLLRRVHESSPSKLIKVVFPEHPWLEWKFDAMPRGWWSKQENQRAFLDWAAESVFKFDPKKQPELWYDVTARQLVSAGGSRLITIFTGSMRAVLSSAYPELRWFAWKFSQASSGFWETVDNTILKEFVEDCANRLGFGGNVSAWYRVSWPQLQHIGAAHIFTRLGGIHAVLRRTYPSYIWDANRLSAPGQAASAGMKASMRRALIESLRSIFPDTTIEEDKEFKDNDGIATVVHAAIARANLAVDLTSSRLENDAYILGESDSSQDSSAVKAALLSRLGIKYVAVPPSAVSDVAQLRALLGVPE